LLTVLKFDRFKKGTYFSGINFKRASRFIIFTYVPIFPVILLSGNFF